MVYSGKARVSVVKYEAYGSAVSGDIGVSGAGLKMANFSVTVYDILFLTYPCV